MNFDQAINLTGLLLALASFISFYESFVLLKRGSYDQNGVLDWHVIRKMIGGFSLSVSRSSFKKVNRVAISLGMLSSLILFFTIAFNAVNNLTYFSLWVLFIVSLYTNYVSPVAGEGTDHMKIVLLVGLLIAMSSQAYIFQYIGLLYIASQTALSYLSSGLAKLSSEHWRNKETPVLARVLSTEEFGYPPLGNFLTSKPRLSWILSSLVIILFISFPVVFIIYPFSLVILLFTSIFHIMTALFMRLNLFPLYFIATYPSILFIASTGFPRSF